MRSACLALVLCCTFGAPAQAVERSSAEVSRSNRTSSLDEASIKPLLLFSMRGRQDPFMAYALMTTTAKTESLSITGLTFSGLLEVGGSVVALFRDGQGRSYSQKGSFLFGPDGAAIEGVRGSIAADKTVTLEQGERRINYSSKSDSKRLNDGRNR
jgi:hypothetical protein